MPVFGFSQNCLLTISGNIKDFDTGLPLEFANIYINKSSIGTSTDSRGFFQLPNICKGNYHIAISHIGCESKQVFVQLTTDTVLNITMEHSINTLEGIVVNAKSTPKTTQNIKTISKQNITDNANENLSNMLESINGVSTLKNGSGISKPVVNGLYGNRLTILNNGISQSGQQWGNDHSPEIDPLVANKIRVIKGASALEYMGSNLGSVILVEPKKIEREPHLHGSANYFFETNGLGNGLNLQLQQYNPKIAWKINGTLKKTGDKKTATYYLNNTGNQEANFALQLEKSFSKNFSTDLYYSTFNTELGVLRGSHIGNLTDLEEALVRETPFFTEDKFSYRIEAPKQRVQHHLLKIHSNYYKDDTQWLDFTFAGQFNNRKEFDVRRSGRIDIPALSLQQYSYFFEGKHQKIFKNKLKLKSGVQFNITDNTNNPETGVLPLIPDYFSYETGAYLLTSKKLNKSFFELGLRYDNVKQNVAAISRTIPREIIRYNNNFQNFSASVGWVYSVSDYFSFSYNIGSATRNPAINELYSNGLHQGVSGIEEGSIALKTENSLKTTLGFNANIKGDFSFESLIYYQNINDFIYLNPQDEIRLTVRGSFPVFKYEQTNAEIYGIDISGKYQINKSILTKLDYSSIRANDLSNNLPLINFPSNNIRGSIVYEFSTSIAVGEKQLENVTIELNNLYVFKQKNILKEQDFVLPPNGYNLLGIKIATDLQLKKTRLRLTTKVDNVLNVAYRDYLNRQRYFANDLGVNITCGVSLKF
ncbi:MAG: iron complex outermembrane receptor protein [Flavobacteriales bacterium]|jgi:iron complex outermembrane receptor protein